jgi:hypothetical protein
VVLAGTPVEVVEIQPAESVQLAGHRHHPVGQPGQQEVGEHERPEVVRRGLQVMALRGTRRRDVHHPGVVDQDMDLAGVRLRERAYRIQIGDIEAPKIEIARHGGDGTARLVDVADGQHHVGPDPGEVPRGDQADPATGTGDQYRPAGHARQLVRGPLGHGNSS